MANSRLWCTAVALLLAYCVRRARAAAAYYKRGISKRVGNGTIQLQLTSGGYLNAAGNAVSYIASSTDKTTTWRVESYIIGGILDDSVYLYNYATGKYLTYIQPLPSIKEGVKVQTALDINYGRWYFYEIGTTGVYKIKTAAMPANYYLSFSGSNKQDGATSFKILPAPPPPPSSPPPPPPAFTQATIQALKFDHVFLNVDGNKLATDGVGKLVDLQYSLDNSNRFQLQLLEGEGSDVYAIRNLASNLYVRLDPTVFPDQEPSPQSPTFHPRGIGRTSAVPTIDALSKFQLIPNLEQTTQQVESFSFKLINANPELPKVYLRFDGKGVVDGKPGGVVNGQTYISDFERFLVTYY